MTITEQDRDGHVRDVVARHRSHTPVARRTPDDAVGPRKGGEHIQVEAVAQERVAEAGGAHVLLGVPVIPGKCEGSFRRGAEEGEVHDPLDAGSHRRRVHGGGVLAHTVVGLAGGDHEEGLYTGQGPPHRLGIVVGGFDGLCSQKIGSAAPVADDQPLAVTQLRQACRHAAAHGTGRARDTEEVNLHLAPNIPDRSR